MGNVKFPTDPAIQETGAGDGKAPLIPLSGGHQGTTEELLSHGQDEDGPDEAEKPVPRRRRPVTETETGERPSQDEAQARQNAAIKATFDPEEDEDDELDPDMPTYSRERVGARIGIPPEEAAKVEQIEDQLDNEDKVPMMFPREVRINDRGLMHVYAPGLHLVPVSLGGENRRDPKMHFYLRHHKVRHAGAVVRANPAPKTADEDA